MSENSAKLHSITWLDDDVIDVVMQYIGLDAFAVYCVLACRVNSDTTAPLLTDLENTTQMPREAVRLCLTRLEECGLIRRAARSKGMQYVLLPVDLRTPLDADVKDDSDGKE